MSKCPQSVLAIETAFPEISVALFAEGKLLLPEVDLSAKRASALHSAVHELLAQAELRPEDLAEIRVDIGPGSYTGLRVGIALVRTWSELFGTSIQTASSTDLGAAGSENVVSEGQDFVVCLDARKGQWFAARYVWQGSQVERLDPPSCLSLMDMQLLSSRVGIVLCPGEQGPEEVSVLSRPIPNAEQLFELGPLLRQDREPAPLYLMPPL